MHFKNFYIKCFALILFIFSEDIGCQALKLTDIIFNNTLTLQQGTGKSAFAILGGNRYKFSVDHISALKSRGVAIDIVFVPNDVILNVTLADYEFDISNLKVFHKTDDEVLRFKEFMKKKKLHGHNIFNSNYTFAPISGDKFDIFKPIHKFGSVLTASDPRLIQSPEQFINYFITLLEEISPHIVYASSEVMDICARAKRAYASLLARMVFSHILSNHHTTKSNIFHFFLNTYFKGNSRELRSR